MTGVLSPKPGQREVTPEMRLAMDLLRSQGHNYRWTDRRELPCGCDVVFGWMLAKYETAIGFRPCARHPGEAQVAAARYKAMEGPVGVPTVEFAEALMLEEVARGVV